MLHPSSAQIISGFLPRFEKVMQRHVWRHGFFFFLIILELFLFYYFFNSLSQSALISVSLMTLFLSVFGYLLMGTYWQTTKIQRLSSLYTELYEQLKYEIKYTQDEPESYLRMAEALCLLADSLNGRDQSLYKPICGNGWGRSLFEKLSHWIHWKDYFQLRENALLAMIEEQIKLVKCEPTSPDAHAALANAYILLSTLYSHPSQAEENEHFLNPIKREASYLASNFRQASERAVEELQILHTYAPHDPWIHQQLAYSYQDLNMPNEEIQAYERILKLTPHDPEVLYKLGVLYFQQGRNTLGLEIYEQLKKMHHKKSDLLIEHYGAYATIREKHDSFYRS